MSSINAAGNTANIGQIDISSMDLESIMMAVQMQRTNLLEGQLKEQISSVQAKNDQISKLNMALGELNALAACFPSDAKASDGINQFIQADGYKREGIINLSLQQAGVRPFSEEHGLWSGNGHTSNHEFYQGGLGQATTKGQLDGAIQKLKSNIDSLSNTQQMDMLRLQSLSSKRNEAFEIATNFIKKMQDGRNAIIGNMR